MRPAIVYLAVVICAVSCARKPEPRIDVMTLGWCDTTPMKPFGLPVAIPTARVFPQFGSVAGEVAQAETGDALQSATVTLSRIIDSKLQPPGFRYTNAKGGFTFDSVIPGTYQIRARRLGVWQDTLTIHLAASRVDTVRFRLRANRCYGY